MRKKTKFNPELLKEELKKFRLLSEYTFYTEDTDIQGYEKNNTLILGDEHLDEADDSTSAAANDIANELGLNDENKPEGETPETETPETETPEAGDVESEVEPADMEEPEEEMPVDDSNDVEIDVTSIVKGTEEAKSAADKATQNTEALLQKLADLESKIASMDAIGSKIDELEKEIVKRNPTPVEKLEMRSLNSYPYSQKLTDFWADKTGQYDVMGNEENKKEYTLTQDDVDSTYSEPEIKKSFTVNPEDFEEENI